MIPPADRPKSTLRALITYAKQRDRWPDLDELRSGCRRNLGSRTTVFMTLRFLEERGFIERRGQTHSSRWVATDAGFDLIGRPRFEPALERQRARTAAASLLVRANRKTPARTLDALCQPLGTPLEIFG